MDFHDLYNGIDDRVVGKLNPPNHGWIQMPASWHEKFRAAVSQTWRESPSSIVSYIECPMKWMLERYLMESDSEEVSYHALLGSLIHRILEVFYNEPAGMRSEERLQKIEDATWSELLEETRSGIVDVRLWNEWQTYLHQQTTGEDMEDGFVTRDEDVVITQMQREVTKRMDRLYDIDPEPDELDVISTETWVRTSKNNIAVNGKIDRIIRDEESELEIVQDYKTGRTPFGDPDVHILENAFIPSGLYALMRSTISQNLSESGVVQAVELLFLNESTIYDIEIGSEEIELADNLLEAVTREMKFTLQSGDLKLCPANSSDTDMPCRFCPVSGLCPAFAEEDAEPYDELEEELPYLWEYGSDEEDTHQEAS